MITTTELPAELVEKTRPLGCGVINKRVVTLADGTELQILGVQAYTRLKMHGHDNQWEEWRDLGTNTAYICLKGEQHELVNDTNELRLFQAIKGTNDMTFEDFQNLYRGSNIGVKHGSYYVTDRTQNQEDGRTK